MLFSLLLVVVVVVVVVVVFVVVVVVFVVVVVVVVFVVVVFVVVVVVYVVFVVVVLVFVVFVIVLVLVRLLDFPHFLLLDRLRDFFFPPHLLPALDFDLALPFERARLPQALLVSFSSSSSAIAFRGMASFVWKKKN